MNTLPPSIRALAARYKSQRSSIASGATHEGHTLTSLSQRLLLSPQETLEQVSNGNLIALSSANGKHVFSSRSLDAMRNRVVEFITGEIVEEMSARGATEDRILFALSRAFQKQHEMSCGRPANIVEFARGDDDNGLRNAALLAGGAAAGYAGYRYLKNRRNADGTPQLPGAPGADGNYIDVTPKPPRDPNSSAENIDVGNGQGRHPGQPSTSKAITTASSTTRKTIGNQVIDPLACAVASGRQKIAQRGSRIWQALRGIPLE